tara:strand:- start:1821 stop:2849 length:1029 start_codon:yes stop_codon:yes gene_type:complete
MFYNIKMKLLIAGKNRNIYMRKDGSAYYKSGGENVDVTYMFKKNGGGLKKQYIGGVQDNLGKVEQKKRSNKSAKQILGGVGKTIIEFDKIEIKSEEIIDTARVYQPGPAPEELKKICCLALYGLGAAMTGRLENAGDNDKLKVTVGKDLEKFVTYLNKAVPDGDPAKAQIAVILGAADKLQEFKRVRDDNDFKNAIKKAGFNELPVDIDFTGDDKCVTVSRAYILNKILQCFEETNGTYIADSSALPVLVPPNSLNLANKTKFIDPILGTFNPGAAAAAAAGAPAAAGAAAAVPPADILGKLQKVFNNIYRVSQETDRANIEQSATNLYNVLFLQEQIGAPA